MSVVRLVDTEEIEIRNPLFLVDTEVKTTSGTDNRDLGIIGKYYDGTNIVYAGLFRDSTDSHFKFFQGLQTLPVVDTGSVDTAGPGYTLSSLDALNIHATGTFTVDGVLTANSDLNVLGNVTFTDITTLAVEDNLVVANAGPANMKEDSGYIVKRTVASVIADTAKQSGTASAAGTTTTITLQAAHGHGTTADYYKGWIISFGGDVTGSATVTTNVAADPPTLTFDTAASGATTTATTYQLFNKQFVGTIYDGSTNMLTAYGFPREDATGVIDPAGDSGNGNLADFIDVKADNLYANNNLYVGGTINSTGTTVLGPTTVDDNIFAINVGPNNLGTDSGFVSQRTPVNVVTSDTPKIAAAAIQTNYVSGSTTLLITNAATGTNYYKGWIIRHNADTTEPTFITASTVAGTTHTLTLNTAFTVALTAGTDTVDLFNKRFVGGVYNEASDRYLMVGFPREASESVIDINTPVNGNIPDYINIAAEDLYINGTFDVSQLSGSLKKIYSTFTTAITFAASDILNNDIIYLNPSAATTYTMPLISSLALPANRSKSIIFINIGSAVATIAGNTTDTIEGLASMDLTRLYSKTTLMASPALTGAWTIS